MKSIFVLFAFFFVLNCSFAQNEIRIGFVSGLTYSKFRGNDIIEKSKAGVSYTLGASLEYPLKNNLSIKTFLTYDKLRSSTENYYYDDFSNPIGNVKTQIIYDYLKLPIVLNYKFGSENKYFVYTGGFISYLIQSKFTTKNAPDKIITKDNKSLDYGLSIGLGKTFKLEQSELNISIVDDLGISNTSKLKVIDDESIKTNTLKLILNYNFNL